MRLTKHRLLQGVAAAALAAAAMTAAYVAAQPAATGEPVIKITAKKFLYTPGEVTVKKGVPVVLEFTSEDVLMGFKLVDFGIRADIVPGKVTRVRLTPDKTGKFEFFCDVFCGDLHEDMNGVLVVVD
jgi:cytochrome c oxidase subunit 2